MVVHVEMHDRAAHAGSIAAYYRLRKKVFHDELRWAVTVDGDEERDVLDDLPCTYALAHDGAGRLTAGVRLIPTTQMTLLDLAFDGLVPDAFSFRSPTIWELSRYCVDHDAETGRMPTGMGLSTLRLTLANVAYARANGITHFIAVTDERIYELTRQFNLGMELLARSEIDGCRIVCGLFAIDERAMAMAERMRPLANGVTPAAPPFDTDAMSRARAPEASPADRGKAEPTRRSPQA